MKRLRVVFLVLLIMLTEFPIFTNAFEVPITAEEATVGNIFWEIQYEDREVLSNGTPVDLVDREGNVIDSTLIEDGLIFFKNIPFGEYFVVVEKDKTKVIPVNLDKSSLDTQHIKQVKVLEKDTAQNAESNVTKTGDSSYWYVIVSFLVSGMILAFYKFSYSKEV